MVCDWMLCDEVWCNEQLEWRIDTGYKKIRK